MVSSDCHARNARAGTTGVGMFPSVTCLADNILTLRSSSGSLVHLREPPVRALLDETSVGRTTGKFQDW